MITTYKNRTVPNGRKVSVYFNLHKKIFSLKGKENGRSVVLAHGDSIVLSDVTFKVSQAGRQRVLKEKQKNVHAFVLGKYIDTEKVHDTANMRQAYYNPYQTDCFVDKETGEKLEKLSLMILQGKEMYYVK